MKGLEGIKVVELASFIAAPASPRLLSELGAEIIKIEPFTGDEQRTQGPGYGMLRDDIEDPAFDMGGLKKNWLSINLKNPKGLEFTYKLIESADIVVTNFRDKALVKLGLDYETIHKKFPHVVYAQMRGYGERGPERDSRGYDATAYSARGGILMSFPQLGESPVNVPAAFGDWNASAFLTAGILAALVKKQMTGEGDRVVVNLYHVACWGMQHAIVSRQSGALYPRSRKFVPTPSNNCYQSKDGVWFLLCHAAYNKFYDEMAKVFEIEELIGNVDYNTLEKLTANKTNVYVIELFEKAFAKKTFAEWEEIFKQYDIPFQKAFTVDDILNDEEAYANDILRRVKYDSYGDRVIPTSPIRMSSVGDPELWTSKPIGYDTREYLQKYGYSEEEINHLIANGAVKAYNGENLEFDKLEKTSAKEPID
ncbi:CaiB/BaiF CoA transferase family protein [Dehalobacterium formicoaceticum]|uniref:CoA transferase n=1 Tax=Dehalobacterium formicoaceticum TaxID=51515 RepID=A0ABT1Y9Q6_9FIRM|nr:CaiB/BaiF CoA-transferase family protein [Dehalobacterium formicoaceticum]MCR6546386.1 CoA transferase [Dehalobacterium formicoaceticum]